MRWRPGPSPDDYATYAEYSAALTHRRAQLLALIFGISCVAGWPTDRYVFAGVDEAVRLMASWRMFVLIGTTLSLALLRVLPFSPRTSGLTIVVGGGSCLIATGYFLSRVDAVQPIGFVHAAYIIPFSTVMLVVPLQRRVVGTLAATAAFCGAYWHGMPITDPPAMGNSVMVSTVFAAFASIAVGHSYFGLVQTTFRQRRALAQYAAELEDRVTERTKTLRRLAAYLDRGREDERRRVVRALHDDTSQLLTGMRLEVATMRAKVDPSDALRAPLDRVEQLILQTIAAARRLIRSLRPLVLDEAGLGPAVAAFLQETHERTGLSVQCDNNLGKRYVDPEVATMAYRTVQEAITNVLRHAEANAIAVELDVTSNGSLRVIVEDDGRGFDCNEVAEGFGIIGMRERAEDFGGTLTISSQPQMGARVELVLHARASRPGPQSEDGLLPGDLTQLVQELEDAKSAPSHEAEPPDVVPKA